MPNIRRTGREGGVHYILDFAPFLVSPMHHLLIKARSNKYLAMYSISESIFFLSFIFWQKMLLANLINIKCLWAPFVCHNFVSKSNVNNHTLTHPNSLSCLLQSFSVSTVVLITSKSSTHNKE